MKEKNTKDKKILKEVIKNEVRPFLIGLRNEIKKSNELLSVRNEATEVDIKIGKKGYRIVKAKDGVTPVRGKNYWTEEDQAFIIKAATPVYGINYFTAEEKRKMLISITPVLGKNYFTEKEQKAWLKIVTPKSGIDYMSMKQAQELIKALTPKKGRDYFDGEAGKTIIKETAVSMTGSEIVKKLENLTGSSKLKMKAIHGLEKKLEEISQQKMSAIGGSGSGSAGVTRFLQLTDVPSTFVGQALKGVRVNAAATALEFFTGSGLVDWGEIGGTITDQTDLINYISSSTVAYADFADASNYAASSGSVSSISGNDHNTLLNLPTGDVHTQYVAHNGRATPQFIRFGTAASASTGYLSSTSNATKGKYFLNAAGTMTVDDLNLRLGIGMASPAATLDVLGNMKLINSATALVIEGATTGNARGANATDVQANVTSTTVASGARAATFGYRNTASGADSVALGVSNSATIADAVAIGKSNSASGASGSVAVGAGNSATGAYCIAVGNLNTAGGSGGNSAIGAANTVTATSDASALGRLNTCAGTNGSSFGFQNAVGAGANNVAMGILNVTGSNTGSIAMGGFNNITGSSAMGIGFNNVVAVSSALAIGTAITNTTATSVEIGTSDSTKIRVESTGGLAIGLGNTTSSAKLHVLSTTVQQRLAYDASNYFDTTVGSTGTVTFNAVGSGSKFVFSDTVELTQTVTTEAVTSDRTVTMVINGTTYKLLAKA